MSVDISKIQQKASVGRVILVTVDPAANNGADVAPAVIVRAWSDTCVNVHILPDRSGPYWLTSIPLFQDREELEAARVKREEAMPHVAGTVFHAAYWPPRV